MTAAARRTTLSAANGGWVRAAIDDDPPFEVRVRPNERGRLEIVELRLAPGGPIDSTTLRQVQLAHVEALVNGASLREYLIGRLGEPGPPVFDRTDAVVQPASIGARAEVPTPRVTGTARGELRFSGTATGSKVELIDSGAAGDSLTVTVKERSAAMLRRSALFKAPPGPKPDDFYEKVAVAYERLSVRSNRPAAEIAEAVEVSLTTVHRWVKRARQLGYLPPGQKGRRG
jgi:hypothetical protein